MRTTKKQRDVARLLGQVAAIENDEETTAEEAIELEWRLAPIAPPLYRAIRADRGNIADNDEDNNYLIDAMQKEFIVGFKAQREREKARKEKDLILVETELRELQIGDQVHVGKPNSRQITWTVKQIWQISSSKTAVQLEHPAGNMSREIGNYPAMAKRDQHATVLKVIA